MAITLRETAIDTSGKATELSYQEMNNNLKSFYYSSSLNGGTLDLHFLSGSTSHSISVPSIYTADSDLTGNRTVTAAGSDLTFDMSTANFILNTDPGKRVTISNLASANTPQVLGIDSNGTVKLMNTSSISGGGSTSPGGSDTQMQYNNGGAFGGATVYFDNINDRVGIGVADPQRPLHISSSLGLTTRFQSSAASSRIQFLNTGNSGNGVLIGSANENDFRVEQQDGASLDINLHISSSGEVYLPKLGTATTPNIVGYNTTTGELAYYSTASFGGGSASPGGSDTQVQFNDGGSFGGDSGFVYDKTSNKLTVVSAGTGATTTPTIQLGTSDVSIAPGDTIGRVSFANDDSTYGGGTSYAAIYAVAPSNWGGGQYPKDVRIAAVASAATVDVATFKGSGVVQLHDYGSGNNTGTAAKYLAVDSSGNVIEEDEPVTGSNIARPGSVDSAETLNELDGGQEWTYNTGTTPSSGQFTTAAVTTVGSITAVAIHYTSANAGNQFNRLKRLCESGNTPSTGTLAITDTNSPFNNAQANIKQVTDNGTFFTVYLSNWDTQGGLTTLVNGTDYDFSVDTCPLRLELSDKSYNRITLLNSTGGDRELRLFAPSGASAGDHILVELASNGSNGTDKLYLQYVVNNSGATSTYDDRWNNIYITEGASSTPQWLFIADNYQMALLEFRVTPSGNLALISADKVARPA